MRKVLFMVMALMFAGSVSAAAWYLDVNESGLDFEVGTSEYYMTFNQDEGGTIDKFFDISINPLQDIDRLATHLEFWDFCKGGLCRQDYFDTTARLGLNEDLNSRVTISAAGMFIENGGAHDEDTNYNKIYTIYPNRKIYIHDTFTNIGQIADTAWVNVGLHLDMHGTPVWDWDSDNGRVPAGTEFWFNHQTTNYTTEDANTMMSVGVYPGGIWEVNWEVDRLNPGLGTSDVGEWQEDSWNPEIGAQESVWMSYMLYLSDDSVCSTHLGDQSCLDAFFLDYRSPADLYMTIGTFQVFDYNVGAYQITAVDNGVDFNIDSSTSAGTDVNRYTPVFEIANYTASTKPVLKYNEVEQTEGVDYFSDVNTAGEYAVVVWMGDILHTVLDGNAQFKIDDAFGPPADVCNYSGTGDWLINDGSTCTCHTEDITLSGGSLIISDGSFSMNNCWLHLDAGENIQVGDWNGMWRDFNSGFKWS